MSFLTKVHSFWTFRIFQSIKHCELLKYISTEIASTEEVIQKKKTDEIKKLKLFTPIVTKSKLEALNDFTSIILAINNISWAKISLSNLTLLEWKAYELPFNFKDEKCEVELLKLANEILQELPSSDLYVSENLKRWPKTFSETYLRTVLVAHLNNLGKDLKSNDGKIVIQDCRAVNILYDLRIGSERKSAKEIVEKLFNIYNQNEVIVDEKDVSDGESSLKLPEMHKLSFIKSSRTEQESLSVALLVACTFLNIMVYKNTESTQKLLSKLQSKRTKHAIRSIR